MRPPPNLATLAAIGALAYVGETLSHEALGHGLACIASGGRVTLIAPLYMHCTVTTRAMVAGGPAANIVAGAASLLALRATRGDTLRFFLWLSLVFNWLVAAGYLLVGAATLFGDWPFLFAPLGSIWRIPAGVLAIVAYIVVVRFAGRELAKLNGVGIPTWSAYARLILAPTLAGMLVAVGAEIYGQGSRAGGIALALGCTLVVGLSLSVIGPSRKGAKYEESSLRIGLSLPAVALALAVSAAFVIVI